MEHYWTYELCHGRYIRQFHEERDGKNIKVQSIIAQQISNSALKNDFLPQTTEYYLGKYDSEKFDEQLAELKRQVAEGTARKPQKKRIETMNMPFYELVMEDGTICDLNGRPRVTRVNYVCYPAGECGCGLYA